MDTAPFHPPKLSIGGHVLRPFRRDDVADWYGYLLDPRVTEHTSWPVITPDLITDLVEKVIAEYAEQKSLRWAIASADDDKLIGSCGYTRWSRQQGTAELAYDLAPSYWGRGIMSVAVRSVVGWAQRSGFIRRVEALVMTTNEPSISVLERNGFAKQRVLLGHREARGIPRDFYLYATAS